MSMDLTKAALLPRSDKILYAARRYLDGDTASEVAAALGESRSLVHYWLTTWPRYERLRDIHLASRGERRAALREARRNRASRRKTDSMPGKTLYERRVADRWPWKKIALEAGMGHLTQPSAWANKRARAYAESAGLPWPISSARA